MLKSIVTNSLFAFLAVFGPGTAPAMAELGVGVIGNLNIATMSSDADVEELDATMSDLLKTKTRFGVGVVLQYVIDERIQVVAEPMFIGKGARLEGTERQLIYGQDVTVEVSGDITSTYLELPLLFKLGLGAADVQPYVLAGPTLGLRLGDIDVDYRVKAMVGEQVIYEETGKEPISDDISKSDIGVAVGGGVSAPLGKGRAFVEAQYIWGLKDIDTTFAESAKNKGLQIRAGLTLPIEGRR